MFSKAFERIFKGRQPAYANNNTRESCVCGQIRRNIANNIFQVTNKETDLIYPKYYYKCRRCGSFSAVNIYFPQDKYEDDFQHLSIDDLKRRLAASRVEWLKSHAEIADDAIIFDLGAGEGAFAHALAEAFPRSQVYAVEADERIAGKFYGQDPRVTFVPGFIDAFLNKQDRPSADLIILTDVLEHLIWPEEVLDQIVTALSPRGLLYMTTPNARTFENDAPFPLPVRPSQVDWPHANRTCQHIFMIEPSLLSHLVSGRLDIVAETDEFETSIRRDSVYSTILGRKR